MILWVDCGRAAVKGKNPENVYYQKTENDKNVDARVEKDIQDAGVKKYYDTTLLVGVLYHIKFCSEINDADDGNTDHDHDHDRDDLICDWSYGYGEMTTLFV